MITIRTRVNNGSIPKQSSLQIKDFLQSNEGKEVEITIKKAKSKRSDPQNRYYFGCVLVIVKNALKDLGHQLNTEECHEWLKNKFNNVSVANEEGEFVTELGVSTTTLSKTEFAEYIERISQWCAEMLHVAIPAPNEQLTIDNQ